MKNFAKPKYSRMFAMLFAKRRFYTFIVGAFFYAFTANSLANNIGYQTPLENCSTMKYSNCCLATTEGDSLSCIHIVTNNFRLKMPNNAKITNSVNNSNGIGTPYGAKSVISAKTEKNRKNFAKTENCSTFAPLNQHNGANENIICDNSTQNIGVVSLGSYCPAICWFSDIRESHAFSIDNSLNNNFLQPMLNQVKNCHEGNNSALAATPTNGAKSVITSTQSNAQGCNISGNIKNIKIINGISSNQLRNTLKSVLSEFIDNGIIDLKNSKL